MALDLPLSDTLSRLDERARDYDRMAQALRWLAERWRERPSLDEAAEAVVHDDERPAGDGRFEFERTVSRLEEMQSADYLGEGHGLRS